MITHAVISGTGNGPAFQWSGGRGYMAVSGTFGGTSLTLEYAPASGGPWVPLAFRRHDAGVPQALAMTAIGCVPFDAPPGHLRPVTSGGSGINITVWLSGPEQLDPSPQAIPQTTTTTTATTAP